MHIEGLLILLMLHEARSLTIQECACSFVAFVLLQLWLHILTHILALLLINPRNFLGWTNIEIDRTFVWNILNVNLAWIDTLHPVAIFVNTLVDAYGIGSWHLFGRSCSVSAYLGGSNLTSGCIILLLWLYTLIKLYIVIFIHIVRIAIVTLTGRELNAHIVIELLLSLRGSTLMEPKSTTIQRVVKAASLRLMMLWTPLIFALVIDWFQWSLIRMRI